MGADQSILSLPPQPLNEVIEVFDRSYVYDEPVSLHVQRKGGYNTSSHVARDAKSGEVLFHVTGSQFSAAGRKVMYDGQWTPIANMAKEGMLHYKVCTSDEGTVLASMSTQMTRVNGCKVTVLATAKDTGASVPLTMLGDVNGKRAVLCIGPARSDGFAIASLHNNSKGRHEFYLDIAAGADIALVVALAVLFEGFTLD